MSWWQLLIYGSATFIMAVISGITGGGGGFVLTPLAIFLGLTPAQAVANSKFTGLAITVGSLAGFRHYKTTVRRSLIVAIMFLAFVVGLIVPFIIRSLESRLYRITLGVVLLLMIPVMMYKKVGIKPNQPSPAKRAIGGVLLTGSLFLQGAFSGGLGSLVNVVLMGMLGMTANEAQITKRWSQLILNITIIFGVLGSKLLFLPVLLTGMTTALVGGRIGSHIAVNKGNGFAVNGLIVLMIISALVLIIGAL